MHSIGENKGLNIHIKKGIPPGSGIGSSASSAAAAVVGINELFGNPYKLEKLIFHGMAGEEVASGSFHADNIAPAILGGIRLIRSYEPLEILNLPIPKKLMCVVVLPDFSINTYDARNMLPKRVPLKSAVEQAGNLAGFTIALYQENYELIVGKWGYYTQCLEQVINPSTDVININLTNGYYDDFTFDFGWTVSGSAETGEWERGIPNPTTNTVMGFDSDFDCGSQAYVTGNRDNVDPDYDDVDNGITVLTSPPMDLTQYANPLFIFEYAFFCNHGPNNIDDTLSFMISNGTENEIFGQIIPPQGNPMEFNQYSYPIAESSLTITNSMTFKIFVSDLEPHVNITEAAFDYFRVEEAWGIDESTMNTFSVYPNPVSESAIIKGAKLGSDFKLISSSGRVLVKGVIKSESHSIELDDLSNGFYFVFIDGVQKKIIKQ